ncbi:arginine biosynthesis protein ArgJ [Pisolithus marmoratus]|nr:arginine biosynthesis protein ArgJ [Pisolithus marmoratus]
MSTNDTIIALANGAGVPIERSSKMEEIDEGTDPEPYHNAHLAQLVVRDGKGATKFVEVSVETRTASLRLISTSAPVKTAIYAEDVNWGRILSSTGSETLGTALDPSSVSISFIPSSPTNSTSTNPSYLHVLTDDEHPGVDEAQASEILGQD